MCEFIEDLKQTNLFFNIEPEEMEGLLHCLCAKYVWYAKGDTIIEEGNKVYDFGIMLSGHGRAIKLDRVILISLLKKGNEVGVVLAASLEHKSPVTVQAEDDVLVLQIPFERVLARCEKACPGHDRLLRNYISIVAEKGACTARTYRLSAASDNTGENIDLLTAYSLRTTKKNIYNSDE